MSETSAQRFKRIVAESAAKAQQKKIERDAYERSRIRVNIDEEDPLFLASPAALIETRDVQILKAIPEIIRTIELTPGEKGDSVKGDKGDKGDDGYTPVKGVDYFDGKDGAPGKPGKDATVSFGELKGIANSSIQAHEKEFDHSKIDPFLLGTKKVSEKGMEKGQVLTFDGDKLIYTTIKQVAQQIAQYVPRGFISVPGSNTLPSQVGKSGKYLKTDGTNATWETAAGGGSGDVVGPASAVNNNFAAFDLTTGKLIKDSGLNSSSFAAALGADDNYVTDAEKVKLSNLSGTNTGDQDLSNYLESGDNVSELANDAGYITNDIGSDTFTAGAIALPSTAGFYVDTNSWMFVQGTQGTSGQVLTSNGDGNGASWEDPPGASSGITRSISTISGDTTAGAAAATDYVYLCDDTLTLTMPTAVSNTNRYTVKNNGAGTVTVAFDGSETGDGSSTLSLLPNVSVDLISDDTNWFVI